jgi:hypothetical protein
MAINTNPSSRRALLAAAAGGTAAFLAESLARPQPARAHDIEDVRLGGANESESPTVLSNWTSSDPVLRVESAHGSAIDANSGDFNAIQARSDARVAVTGVSQQSIGVVGWGGEPPGGGSGTVGVQGMSGAGSGVAGICLSGVGVSAESDTGVGLYARSNTGRAEVAESWAIGIESHTNGTTTEEDMFGADVIGVWGLVDGPGGFGIAVKGDGANGVGVLGQGGHCGVAGDGDRIGVFGKSLPGVAVQGDTQDGIAVSANVFGSGVALLAHGPVIFDSAGRDKLVGGKAKVTPGVALDDSSKVLVTLMANPGAKAQVPYVDVTSGPAGTGFFRVFLPGAKAAAIPFAYFVIA